MGRMVSEPSGMKYCGDGLRGIIPEVPIGLIAAGVPLRMLDPQR